MRTYSEPANWVGHILISLKNGGRTFSEADIFMRPVAVRT